MKTTPRLRPEICNVLYYKFPLRALRRLGMGLVLVIASGAFAAGPCCPPPKPEPKPCCPAPQVENRDSKIENFSAASLYQLDAAFTTDAGTRFSLGELRGRPVIVAMFFASCTYACPLIVADLTRVRDSLPADVRDRAALVLVSFDPARDTPAALRKYREDRLLDDAWILLHASPDTVRELAALLGVKYKQEADGQFAHSNLFTVLNPAGEIVHQRAGLTGGLLEAAAALTRAARP